MFVLEFKCRTKETQALAIDEAIRTAQFLRNKALRYWMENRGVGQKDIYRYSTQLRKEFSFVADLNSTACQASVEPAWSAIARFYANCKKNIKGKKGYPKFKKRARSVEYKTSGWKLSEDRKKITFKDKKGIGTLRLIGTRDLNYFQISQIKRVRLVKRADGYYCQFNIQEDIRAIKTKELELTQKCVGLDMGLKVFYADSYGNTVDCPKSYRKAEKQLNFANRKKSKKFRKGQKQSNNYKKACNRYARKHLAISRKRKGFAQREALRVIQSNDLVAYEKLNVKGLVKNRKLAKSIPPFPPFVRGGQRTQSCLFNDAAWSTFIQWLEYFAKKYGKAAIGVPPDYTSVECSNCGAKVPKTLSTRTHVCPVCSYTEDRDVNAAIKILKRALRLLSTAGRAETNYAWEDLPSSLIEYVLSSYGESANQESSHL